MGEIVGLCIGSYEFLSRKNTFGDLLSIFSQDDLTIEEVFDKELDESITRRYFTTTVNNAKMCLDVMGHTTLKAKSLFEYHKKNYLDYLEEDFDDEVDSDNIERKYTFENWARAVSLALRMTSCSRKRNRAVKAKMEIQVLAVQKTGHLIP